MLLKDREIIKKYRIKPSDKILDVGGSMTQHTEIKIDTLVDIIRPEDSPYKPEKLLAKNFVKRDIIREKLPFKNKEFDFCLCTHTLEDLAYPFLIIEEMSRVAKKGLIVTPSMGEDMVFGKIDFTDWLTGARRVPGHAHHKWFFVSDGKKMKVIPKNYPLLYTSDFHFVDWKGEKEFEYFWKDNIDYEEFKDLDFHELINEYGKFKFKNRSKIKQGRVLYFIDSIPNYLSAFTKKILRIGEGYKH